jgi:CRISPR-associated protein Cmr1
VAKLEFNLTLITPLFSYGADQKRPEIRTASVRGQLRYWRRAIIGAYAGNDLKQVWGEESAVFGSTSQGSRVQIRVVPVGEQKIGEFEMLPHRIGENRGRRAPAPALAPETHFQLQVITRPNEMLSREMADALALWLLIGGLGKRSRRLFGAFELTEPLGIDVKAQFGEAVWHDTWSRQIASVKTYIDALRKYTLKKIFKGKAAAPLNGTMPRYPTLHPEASRIVVCKQPFQSYHEANEALFGKLRSREFNPDDPSYQAAFGGVYRERRASPLHAQVRRFEGSYHLILTAMRSQAERERRNWKLLNQFMDKAVEDWSGEDVWGKLI